MPRTATKPKHIHKYIRTSGKFTFVWKCADPYCKHYIHGSQAYTIYGRASICWNCDKPFALSEDAMQVEMPICPLCAHPQEAEVATVMDNTLEEFPITGMDEMKKKLIEMGVILPTVPNKE